MTFPEWAGKGCKQAIDHARKKMEEILSTRKTEPLTPQQEQAVEDILQDTRDHYRKSGFISDEDWKLYREDLASPNCPFA